MLFSCVTTQLIRPQVAFSYFCCSHSSNFLLIFDALCHYRASQQLGSGQFGTVKRGTWYRQSDEVLEVALKAQNSSQDESNDPGRIKLLQEAAIMVQFSHPNVLKLYGVARHIDSVRSLSDYIISSAVYCETTDCVGDGTSTQR